VDTGITGGFGFNIVPNLIIEARYKQGFVDMYEWWFDGNTQNIHLNQTFQLGLSYKFER
jgi:opacity protein-like surface antigen